MDNLFYLGFSKVAESDKVNPKELAVGAGLTAGGAAALKEGVIDKAINSFKHRDVKPSRDIKGFLGKLKPGDVIVTGAQKGSALDEPIVLKDYFENFSKSKSKLVKALGKKKLPINEHDLLNMVSGSPYYHMAIYTGKGNVVNADGNVVRGEKLKNMIEGGRAKAYRMSNDKKEVSKALGTAKKLKGREYKNIKEQVSQGARMLADPTQGGKACRKINGRVVCTDVVSSAYPEKLKKRIISEPDIRKAPGSKLVGRYSRAKMPSRHAFTSGFISPIARSSKWALPAAAAVGIGGALYNRFTQNKKPKPTPMPKAKNKMRPPKMKTAP